MADAVLPRWHGDNYQSRIFWENALNLLDPTSFVVEVTFEANGPKAFDDVVVKYDPPVARSAKDRISADYHQVKWHVTYGDRFGYEDFVDPKFIGAVTVSILERLRNARAVATPTSSCFTLITVARIKDDDPLSELISATDKSLLVERLFDGTTDKSRMGKVRKLWREHMNLENDEDLRQVVKGLRVFEGHRSLEEMRAQINLKAHVVGLLTYGNTSSDFRYDELARQLKARGINALTRESLERLCQEEGLFAKRPAVEDRFKKIAVRSFLGPAADITGATPENTLLLTDEFRQRYLRDDLDWQKDIRPKVESFLRASAIGSSQIRLVLDSHASIAFLAGTVLNLKSGVEIELVQNGRVGSQIWKTNDGLEQNHAAFIISTEKVGSGNEIAVAINVSQAVNAQARAYIASRLPNIGTLLSFTLLSGPSHQSITGGAHASALAEQVSNTVRAIKTSAPDAMVHIFASCPNALLFYLGQGYQGIAPCIVYEFDFDRRNSKTYQPSFIID